MYRTIPRSNHVQITNGEHLQLSCEETREETENLLTKIHSKSYLWTHFFNYSDRDTKIQMFHDGTEDYEWYLRVSNLYFFLEMCTTHSKNRAYTFLQESVIPLEFDIGQWEREIRVRDKEEYITND